MHYNTEEVVDAFGVPFRRKYLSATVCTDCHGVSFVPAPQVVHERLGKTPGIAWRIGVTYTLIAMIFVAFAVAIAWEHHAARTHLADPIVGDRWTVTAAQWPGDAFENSLKYGIVRVEVVTASSVALLACNLTGDDETDVRKGCRTFEIPAGDVRRSDLDAMLDADTIERVHSDRENRVLINGLVITPFVLLLAWGVVCSRWKKRIALPE